VRGSGTARASDGGSGGRIALLFGQAVVRSEDEKAASPLPRARRTTIGSERENSRIGTRRTRLQLAASKRRCRAIFSAAIVIVPP